MASNVDTTGSSDFEVYAWPSQPRIVAPEPNPDRLVTWSQFRGYGGIAGGLVAWIGTIRIGRIDFPRDETDEATWFFGLPWDPEDDEDCPHAATGHGAEAACRRMLERAAEAWLKKAGLMRVADFGVM